MSVSKGEVTLNRKFLEMMRLLNVYLNHFPRYEKYALANNIRNTAYGVYDLITECQKRYYIEPFMASLALMIVLMLSISSSFSLQNAPNFTSSNNIGCEFFQFFTVPTDLFSFLAISLYVMFFILNDIVKYINKLLNSKKVTNILLFKNLLKPYNIYFYLKRSFIYYLYTQQMKKGILL